MGLDIEWAALSDVGRQRDHNEDCYLADAEAGMWVVCDGMGGHNSGEDASRIAAHGIHHFLSELKDDTEVGERLGTIAGLPSPAMNVVRAIRFGNERIFIEALKDPSKEGMGTTAVVVVREGGFLILATVGDSRIYRLRGNMFEQVSVDHSLLNHLIATKGLSRPEAEHHAQGRGNVIVRALGLKDEVDVDIRAEQLKENDIYMMCSDGLSDMVDDNAIGLTIAQGADDLEGTCQRLIDMANAAGGRDNITVCTLRVVGR